MNLPTDVPASSTESPAIAVPSLSPAIAFGAPEETPFHRIAADFAASRIALFGLALFALIVLCALFAPLISPQNPYDLAQLDVLDSRLEPGARSGDGKQVFWLGTDDQGRDMLSAIFYGLRISIGVGVTATLCALTLGLTMGLTAAFFGGRVDGFIMRVVDIQLSFPAILIALILLAAKSAAIRWNGVSSGAPKAIAGEREGTAIAGLSVLLAGTSVGKFIYAFASANRTRGSSTEYSTSTTRLMTMNSVTMIRR